MTYKIKVRNTHTNNYNIHILKCIICVSVCIKYSVIRRSGLFSCFSPHWSSKNKWSFLEACLIWKQCIPHLLI